MSSDMEEHEHTTGNDKKNLIIYIIRKTLLRGKQRENVPAPDVAVFCDRQHI